LRRAWVGYQERLDRELAAAGFPDRRFPDGRVLRLCDRTEGVTPSQIGRELGITRQGAGKIVAGLRDRGYVNLEPSSSDGREKVVTLTSRARDYLDAQRNAALRIERQLYEEVGSDSFDSLTRLLAALDGPSQPRLRDYLGRMHQLSND
jgi:DNA-binding MarR family transcriptional regulator